MTQLDDLQREVEHSRAKLDLTLDRLEDKMTVSGVIDDALGTTRAGSYAPLFDHVTDTLRRNPVPVLLIAAGVGLLLHRLRPKAVPVVHTARAPATDTLREIPPEPRLYRPGASTLQTHDEFEGRQRAPTTRI